MMKHNHNDNSLPYVSTIKKHNNRLFPDYYSKSIVTEQHRTKQKKSVTLHSLFQSSPNPTIRHNYHFRCSYSYAIEQEKAINVRRSCRQNRQGKAAASSRVGRVNPANWHVSEDAYLRYKSPLDRPNYQWLAGGRVRAWALMAISVEPWAKRSFLFVLLITVLTFWFFTSSVLVFRLFFSAVSTLFFPRTCSDAIRALSGLAVIKYVGVFCHGVIWAWGLMRETRARNFRV